MSCLFVFGFPKILVHVANDLMRYHVADAIGLVAALYLSR